MNNIAIINNECFRDTDIPLAKLLEKRYIIDYYIILDRNSKISKEEIISYIGYSENITVHFINGKYRRRDIRYFLLMSSVLKKINKKSPKCLLTGLKDDIFCNFLLPLLFKDKILYLLHDAQRHPSNGLSLVNKIGELLDKLMLASCKRFLLFSAEQYSLFHESYPSKRATYIPKPIHDYGESKIDKPNIEKECNFLFLGRIDYYKGLDILIEAIEALKVSGQRKMKLSIYGTSANDEWRKHIKNKNIYNLQIRFFDDSEIPDIFSTHHFLIQPYRQVTQSGPFSIALSYGLPVIASNIGIFSHLISNGNNGFLFEKESINELRQCLEQCLRLNMAEYSMLSKNVIKTKESLYNEKQMVSKVVDLIE